MGISLWVLIIVLDSRVNTDIQNMKLIYCLGAVGHRCNEGKALLKSILRAIRMNSGDGKLIFRFRASSVYTVHTVFHAVNPICEAGNFLLLVVALLLLRNASCL